MRHLYSLAISFYALAVRCASLFNGKANLMRKGWHNWQSIFTSPQFKTLNTQRLKTAWFHASSLGEFEQARPVMETFRKQHPEYKIVLTFFSPSGYEVRKNYDGADIVCYLPPDTRRNARRLMQLMHPDIAFFVKYDFWFNYLQALERRTTPTYLFSAIFRPGQYFFKGYGSWFARQLQIYRHIFVQNDESVKLLRNVGVNRCSIAGDTRFDRVSDIARQAQKFPAIENFIAGYPVLIAGSSWQPDEENICRFVQQYHNPLKIILAPHIIDEKHLLQIDKTFSADNCTRYSQLTAPDPDPSLFQRKVLIIDNIGMLSSLYRYATVSYIGGGFGRGIHNTLEAAIFGCPLCFGPNYHKFQEAHDLINSGAAKSYNNADELCDILTHWFDTVEARQNAAEAVSQFMQSHLGATKTILDVIERNQK